MITTHTNTIILVDMDGVLCDFNQSLLRNAHEKLGAPLLTNKDCTTFYTEEMFGSQFPMNQISLLTLHQLKVRWMHLMKWKLLVLLFLSVPLLRSFIIILTVPKKSIDGL